MLGKHIAKVFFLLIIAIGFFWAQSSQAAGWVSQSSGTTGSIKSIDMYNATFGFAVGQNNIILRTTDGGKTWAASGSLTASWNDVDVVDSLTAWAVGDGGKIAKTTNGGDTWAFQTSGVTNNLYSIKFASAETGFIVGSSGTVLNTFDSGANWTKETPLTSATLFGVDAGSYDGVLKRAWAVGLNGVILKFATQGGWVLQNSNTTNLLQDVFIKPGSNSAEAWVVANGVSANGGPGFLKTTNIGQTWSVVSQDVSATGAMSSVKMLSNGIGMASLSTGKTLKTIDGGATWLLDYSSGSSFLEDVVMVDTGSVLDAWVVGWAGQIVRYDETAPTAPGNLTKTPPDTDNTPTLTWSMSSDDTSGTIGTGIAKYEVQSDGSPFVSNFLETSITFQSMNDGQHTFAVRAVDAAGNAGPLSTLTYTIDTTAPTVGAVTPTTATAGQSKTFSVAYSDIVGVTSCELYVNDISQGNMSLAGTTSGTATKSYTFSSAGSYAVKVKCGDGTNTAWGVTTTVTVTAVAGPDTTAPTVSAVTPITAVVGVSQTYSATYSDNVGVSSCKLFIDGDTTFVNMTIGDAPNGTATKSLFFSTTGSHTLRAKCTDASANTSQLPAATTITVSAAADTVAPTVGAISPATATVNSAQSFAATYSDNVGVTSCELYVSDITQGNMSLAGTTSGTATKSYTFLSAGSYAVKAKCSDGTNTTWGAVTTVVVTAAAGPDTTPPTGSVTINSGAEYTKTSSVTLTLTCSDNVACTRMQVAVGVSADTATLEAINTNKTVTLSGGDGTKTVAVKFKDSATNASAQYTDTIILDTTAQDTTIIEKPASPSTVGLGYFSFGYSGSSITPVTFECRMDTGVFSTCSAPKIYEGLSAGNHTFYVRAVDAAGNVDATADSYTWTITSGPSDTTSPTVGSITPVTAQAAVSQSFTVSYSDAVGVVSCDLYVDSSNQGAMTLSGITAGTASRAYTFTSTASHSLQARCFDAAGNTGLGSLTTISVSAAPINQTDTSAPTVPPSVKKVSDDSDKTPTFTWNSSSDNNGVTSYVVQVDNGSLVDIGGAQTYTAGSLFDGAHTLKVFAKDAAGNSSPVASFGFTVKTVITDTPVSCSLTINGAYKLSGSPAVYYITDECNKRAFNKSNVFFTYFNSWSDAQLTTKTKLDKIPLDTLGFMPWGPKYDPKYGALVKIVTDPKVYLLLGGEKYWIIAEEVFTGLKYSWNWVEDIDKKLLDKYITGSEITYTDHHPNYTLIKYAASTKIYRLEPDPADSTKQVKRHIKNETVFNALNFRWDRIVTISKSEMYKDGAELSEDDI